MGEIGGDWKRIGAGIHAKEGSRVAWERRYYVGGGWELEYMRRKLKRMLWRGSGVCEGKDSRTRDVKRCVWKRKTCKKAVGRCIYKIENVRGDKKV